MPANHKPKILPLILLLIVVCSGTALAQQTTAFTYQGSLSPAGTYNLKFELFGSSSGGVPIGTQTFPNVNVSGGTFTVVLDFGASAFPGADRWLETTVNSTTLSPRVQITSVPYAIRASNVGPITGSDPNAMFSVTNTHAGVTNPSFPANVPPSAVRGEATSSVDTSAGLIGISAGTFGIGVVGISSGTPGANDNPTGVFGQASSVTGKTRGVTGIVRSPNGIAVQAISTGGSLFEGSSGPAGSELNKFSVDAAGNVNAAGNVLIGSGTQPGNLDVTGNLHVVGTTSTTLAAGGSGNTVCINGVILSNCSSSVRYKRNILPLGAGLDVVGRLRPITFKWKEGGLADLGLVAEEVNDVEPLLVTRNGKGEIEGVKYDRLSAVFINAFKEQQAQIQKQQQEIKLQQNQIESLKQLVCRSHRKASICK